MERRYIGIDLGAETIKVVELRGTVGALRWTRRAIAPHHKDPGAALVELLGDPAWDFAGLDGAAVSGRLGRLVDLVRVPTKQAQAAGQRYLHGDGPATVVSIGSHGFSVLELRPGGVEVLRENSRCSQGTGNFLRQLVERFDLDIDAAAEIAADVPDPAPLSGRCPVILKTDMTHLANKGESRARILAGLFDAVGENVQVLIKPGSCPSQVALIGGVTRSRRVRASFERFLAQHGMTLLPSTGDDALYCEALGTAIVAAEGRAGRVPRVGELLRTRRETVLERVPALAGSLDRVKRLRAAPLPSSTSDGKSRRLVLGFDIGSTGSKVVALDADERVTVWEGYGRTNGDPVAAAQALMRDFANSPSSIHPVIALGATGSGREIVGSLMANCYGGDAVFILNEIAAHAEGALFFDPHVDTIFEIGGQDAKYIRLAEGRVIDAAMNEACSAGTGSFIEEQGRKLAGIRDVAHLGEEALAATAGVSLGQHCSVFMAEIIDEAVAAGAPQREIVAGIYESIVQNYLNRVKGSRSVGQVIFCQGMPFAADALAAAVVRQTGSEVVVPPNPGTVGALGIALLACKRLGAGDRAALDPARFLGARVERKDTFVCKAVEGCGGAGNKCRIDRLTTLVAPVVPVDDPARRRPERQRFTWGGGCALWDKGTRKQKLPDRAPDPFRERAELLAELIERVTARRGRRRIALTDEFVLKGLFPFFATFLDELGFDLVVSSGGDHAALKRGIERANVPFCAPMQLYHGLATTMATREPRPDYVFLPMLRELPRAVDEKVAVTCPIVQGSADVLRLDLARSSVPILSPIIDIGIANLESESFVASCRRLAVELGSDERAAHAHFRAARAQKEFDARCLDLGRAALAFCAKHEVLPVVVLGRPYTVYNKVLNSNVPAILREQGAIAIPSDCYPVATDVPVFDDMFWGHGQRNLRAAHQIRRTPGIYSLYCSNYSCGPDSFNLHFYGYIMEGKPFAIIETDGHSGDAGTKTRVEAFLHCVREDQHAGDRAAAESRSFKSIELDRTTLPDVRRRGERVLVPRMGPGAEVLTACLRGAGIPAETLPRGDRDALRVGRRYTSGKECVPMAINLGTLLCRLERDRHADTRFAFLFPTASGPCRYGAYTSLQKITLERLGWKDRVRVWSPSSSGYFDGIPGGFSALCFSAFMAADLLLDALYDTRPVETRRGAALAIYRKYDEELRRTMERAAGRDVSVSAALAQVASGACFGTVDILRRAARELAAIKGDKVLPTVLLVGEIWVRCDPFANDFIVEKLEERGLRVRFAPFNEWLEYIDEMNLREGRAGGLKAILTSRVQSRIQTATTAAVASELGWPRRTTTADSTAAAAPYLRRELIGEAILTLGGSVHEWREGRIDAVVSVGPHECMPNKIAEAQLFHVAEREGLLSLTLPLNGDPTDPEVIDNFAFEVHSRFARRRTESAEEALSWLAKSRRLFAQLVRRPVAGADPIIPPANLLRPRPRETDRPPTE